MADPIAAMALIHERAESLYLELAGTIGVRSYVSP